MYITDKTLRDLEFPKVLEQVALFCVSEFGKQQVLAIKPIENQDVLTLRLNETDEYLKSFQHNNRIPNHSFYDIAKPIELLRIENTYILPEPLLELVANVKLIEELTRFFEKFKWLYPLLYEQNIALQAHFEMISLVTNDITEFAEIDDNASEELKQIRKSIRGIENKISSSFTIALQRYVKLDYLDEIRESVVDGKRVLAVQATHRRKVSGSILGTSKTGSIIFILPQETQQLDQELQFLSIKQKEEEIKILKKITDTLRPYREVLQSYTDYLIALDVIGAKAKYAQSNTSVLPKISTEQRLSLKRAYHPLLKQINQEKGIVTIPQTIELHQIQQIIVISGPNAGGKSLTLKTIGLLQVMLQSGLMVPVDETSEMWFFDTILTDIGDNQSIENQLSTYSYRLKNMRIFLKKCNAKTLFLIDEFGTGSDPELGGALAEVFLEELYHKKSYGVITTHYTNIKALADHLENAVNANMQFDKSSLEPLYELVTGQAGSSFTFEVAQKNGIPFNLINRAKKRVSGSKVRLDKTISKLQTERNKLQRETESLAEEKALTNLQNSELVTKQQKVQEKLEQFQLLYDYQQKMLQYGRSVNEMTNKYFQSGNKKQLLAEFNEWVQAEKVKFMKKNPPKIEKKNLEEKIEKPKKTVHKKVEVKLENIEKEVLKEVEVIREVKAEEVREQALQIENYEFQIGDIVRIKEGWAQGTLEKVDKKKVIINYGTFTTQAKKDQIELVRKAKS